MKTVLGIALAFVATTALGQAPSNPLFHAFKQGKVESQGGKAGNCASVAIIKAAIGTYGINHVFSITKAGTVSSVDLKDGTRLELIDSELAHAAAKSAFAPASAATPESQQIFNYAQLCFAVLCKNYQKKFAPNQPYEQVVTTINGGYATARVYELLGLKAKFLGNNPSYATLLPYQNLVLWNSAHAVYYSQGFYDEAFDTEKPGVKIEELSKQHCSVAGWIKNGCKPRGAYQLID